jgi:hypothetical protein
MHDLARWLDGLKLSQYAWVLAESDIGWEILSAGVMFLNHIAVKDGKDRIAERTLEPCPSRLSCTEAEAAAGYLITLEDPAMKTGVIDATKKLRKRKA